MFLLSCADSFLDLKPLGTVGSQSFYKTQADALQGMNGIYADMRSTVGTQILLAEVRSDNSVAEYDAGNRAAGNPEREQLDEFRDNASNPTPAAFWGVCYSTLFDINTFLGKVDNISFDDAALKDRLVGEAKFVRAYIYFGLVRIFGDVPLVLTPLDKLSDAYTIGRTPAADIYTQIRADIQDALAVLPVSYDNTVNHEVGRITKGAALTLSGKVYLTLKDYDNAQTALDQVTTLGYTLNPNYEDVFKQKNSPEGILEFQYAQAAAQSFAASYQWVPRGSGKDSPWDLITGGLPGNVFVAWNIPSKDLMNAFEPNDLRRDVTYKIVHNALVGAVPGRSDIQYVNKWIPYVGDCNFQAYRYADVLLMLAEVHAQKNDGQAAGFLNEVRTRAGLPNTTATTQSELLLAVEKERRIELAFEGHRWFDLLRTGRAKEVMNAYGAIERADPSVYRNVPYGSVSFNVTDARLLYPIPLAEIQKNPSVLTQNPGY